MSCEDYRELLSDYLEDDLDDVRRTGLRAHLSRCAECRDAAIALDPTFMLTLAGRPEPPADRIEACVTGVMAGIRQEKLQRRLQPSRRPWFAAAAAVILAVVASTVWWMGGTQPTETPALQADANEVEVLEPAAPEASTEAAEPPPRVEVDMTQEEVRVYQYAIGDDGTTGAVFIVNPAMEL
jgi:predicted anti-sigma-YlaC factor YlaD